MAPQNDVRDDQVAGVDSVAVGLLERSSTRAASASSAVAGEVRGGQAAASARPRASRTVSPGGRAEGENLLGVHQERLRRVPGRAARPDDRAPVCDFLDLLDGDARAVVQVDRLSFGGRRLERHGRASRARTVLALPGDAVGLGHGDQGSDHVPEGDGRLDRRPRSMNDRLDPAWLDELSEWLRIPSVSADAEHADDVRRAGEWVCEFVRGAGGEAELVDTDAQPLAVGEIRASTGADEAPTVLLYGHFDVQPPAPLDLWESDPFEPEIRDGLYARGAVDDKGNSYLILKAARLLAQEGALPVNVRIAFDGEEEIGGDSIVHFLAADERGADACLIFDSGMPREDTPAFDLGVRGLAYFHVASGPESAICTRVFGGAALNAVHALMQALEAVVAVPDELRAGVIPPTQEEIDSGRARARRHRARRCGAKPMDAESAEAFYHPHAGRLGRGRERAHGRRGRPPEDGAAGVRRGERLDPARSRPGRRRDQRVRAAAA